MPYAISVSSEVNVVAGRLPFHGVAPLVGVHGVFFQEADVGLEEPHHLGRQAKDGQAVDALVGKKAPAPHVGGREQTQDDQQE
jgi:hypothetical protein